MASQVHILAKDIQVLVKKEKIYKFSISRKDIQIISGVEGQESWAPGSQSTILTNSMGPLAAKNSVVSHDRRRSKDPEDASSFTPGLSCYMIQDP